MTSAKVKWAREQIGKVLSDSSLTKKQKGKKMKKVNYIKQKCIICGKEFLKYPNKHKPKLPKGIYSNRRITCSRKCSNDNFIQSNRRHNKKHKRKHELVR